MANPDRTRRIREIFEAVVELPAPAVRLESARLACDGDAELCSEVVALLEASDAAESLLPDTPSDHVVPTAPGEKAGDRLGRFVLQAEIGSGGCGVVFRAIQTEPVRREVAIKVIKLGMDTRSVVARFEAERQALAMMDHPNIARVFDGGTTASGRPYFVMELVSGVRITDYCETGRLDIRQRLELFIPVCQAVQHAHQKGVIHRDLKPSNVLVARVDGVAVPKVIDFGVAKATGGPEADGISAALTQVPVLLGTPAYMSPEQADLDVGNVDTRADIYSLGVLLYELLTGTTPFDGRRLMQGGLDEMRRILREEEPPAPSGRRRQDPRATRLDPDLDWIVMKCLEKDRTRRYAAANDLALDLHRHLRHEAVEARPPSRRYRLAKLAQRHRGAVSALATILALLFAGAAISSWQAVRARRAERAALLQAYLADMKSAGTALEAGDFGQASEFLRRHIPGDNEIDRRGLEWRFLWPSTRGDAERTVWQDRWINCARLSPDGSHLALNVFGGETRVLRAADGRVLRTFPGAGDKFAAETLAFSPDGRLLASGSERGVMVHDTAHWQLQREWPGSMDAVAFSPDGRLFGRLDDAGAHLHEVGDWRLRGHITNRAKGFGRLIFSPDGQSLAIFRRAHPVVGLWDVETLQAKGDVGEIQFPLAGAFSPDGRWLAVGNSTGDLRVWDVAQRSVVVSRKAHDRYLFAVAFSPDGRLIATAGGDHLIHLWKTEPAAAGTNVLSRLATLRGHRNEIWSLSFSSDGRQLLSAGRDGSARFWNPRPPDNAVSTLIRSGRGVGLGSLPRSRLFVTLVQGTNQLQIWESASGRLRNTVSLPAIPHGAVVLDGAQACFGTTHGSVEVWRLPDGEPVVRAPLTDGPLLAIQAAVQQQLFLGWDRSRGGVALWSLDPAEQKPITSFPDFAIPEMSPAWSISQRAAFSPDGRWLAYASTNYTVKLWDVQRRAEAVTLQGHVWHIQCLRFSPDGRRLITGSWDGLARVWDAQSGRELLPPLRHATGVGSIAVSADGRAILTRSGDDRLHFWSAETGAESLTVPGVTAWFFNLLSPDGSTLVWEEGYSGRYRVHHLPTLEEIDRLERSASAGQ